MNIQELKLKTSEQLITQAEKLGIENASTLRKQEILFAILKNFDDLVLELCFKDTRPFPRCSL